LFVVGHAEEINDERRREINWRMRDKIK